MLERGLLFDVALVFLKQPWLLVCCVPGVVECLTGVGIGKMDLQIKIQRRSASIYEYAKSSECEERDRLPRTGIGEKGF